MATETRSCWLGYTPSARPASDAPTAGAYGDVNVVAVLGFRLRKGAADGSSRWARSRVKNRNKSRYMSNIVLSDSDSRSVEDLCSGCFFWVVELELYGAISDLSF